MSIVRITQEEMEFISKVGLLRTEENKNNKDIADYDPRRFTLSSLQANRLGVMAEAAVVKYFGYDICHTPLDVWPSFYMNEHKDLYDGADVNVPAGSFEVRRVNKKGNPVAIRRKDVEENAIVIQAYIHYIELPNGKLTIPKKQVEILGWVDAAAAWDDAEVPAWSTSNKSRVTMPNPMSELGVAA